MFDLPTFTLVHVVASVFGIVAGLVAVGGLLAGTSFRTWTALFLGTTVFTSVSGFGFPSTGAVSPAQVTGVISLVVLAVCLVAHYGRRTTGRWQSTYVVTAVAALYLNVFVLVVQLFAKTPALAQLAPTQREAPFALTQALVLLTFVWIGWSAVRSTRGSRAFA
ncbi:MAG TPA: hypothetical protein VNS57_06025 [Steroidobacteraceae bacterium]|nr:hypothetical protein [Steroidobacteraceae bacterium]